MRVGVMCTDGGAHPPDKWAAETAAEITQLIRVDQDSSSPDAVKARKALPRLELDLADAIEHLHEAVADHENELLAEDDARLMHPYTPHPDHMDEAVEAIQAVGDAYGHPFAEGFRTEEAVRLIRNTLGHHFASNMHVARGWHVARAHEAGEASEHTRAFHKRWHG